MFSRVIWLTPSVTGSCVVCFLCQVLEYRASRHCCTVGIVASLLIDMFNSYTNY